MVVYNRVRYEAEAPDVSDKGVKLTYGVEMEFLIEYGVIDLDVEFRREIRYAPKEKLHWLWQRLIYYDWFKLMALKIVDELRRLGFKAVMDDAGERPDFAAWVVSSDGSLELKRRDMDTHGPLRHFLAIELKSPILQANQKTLLEVAAVASAIRRKFKVLHNRSCGVHVHVGNQTKGFPLHILRNTAVLASGLEMPINMLHPHHRQWNKYCKQLNQRDYSALDRRMQLEAFAKAETVNRLVHLTNYQDKYWTVNFRNNLHRRGTRTVEFRQHKATFDRKKLVFWIQFVLGLMRFAAMHETEEILSLVSVFGEAEDAHTMLDEIDLAILSHLDPPIYSLCQSEPPKTDRDRPAGLWSHGPGECSPDILYHNYMDDERDLEVTFPEVWLKGEAMDTEKELVADMNPNTPADSWDGASESSNEAEDDV